MKKFNFLLLPLLLALSTLTVYPQFDQLLFRVESSLKVVEEYGIFRFGDQNNDGYGDIILFERNTNSFLVFYGGNPMDTLPDVTISLSDAIPQFTGLGNWETYDIDNDGYMDILAHIGSIPTWTSRAVIFKGGPDMDDEVDGVIDAPSPHTFTYPQIIGDYDGNGYTDIVFMDNHNPFGNPNTSYLLFYEIQSIGAPVLKAIAFADSTVEHYYQLDRKVARSITDVNNDGYDDVILCGYYHTTGEEFRRFLFGNSSYNVTETYDLLQSEYGAHVALMNLLPDVNGDGLMDIVKPNGGDSFPSACSEILCYGTEPLTVTPSVGLYTEHAYQTLSCGDVNGDGYNDILMKLGPNGLRKVSLFLGGANVDSLPAWHYGLTSDWWNEFIYDVGDVDGDGVDDVGVGYGHMLDKNYVLEIFKGDTSVHEDPTGIDDDNQTNMYPEEYKLYDNYPNPFNPSTTFRFALPFDSDVKITIYDIMGREILSLIHNGTPAGYHNVLWNGRNSNGAPVASGIYLYRFEAESLENNQEFIENAKMMMLK